TTPPVYRHFEADFAPCRSTNCDEARQQPMAARLGGPSARPGRPGSEEVVAAGGEAVDEHARFQGQDAVGQAGGDDEAAAAADDFRYTVDGYLEAAGGDVAGLHVRVVVRSADAAGFEAEGDLHQFGGAEDHLAAVATAEIGPLPVFCMCK